MGSDIHISKVYRDFIEYGMHVVEPEGSALCDPTVKKIRRGVLVSIVPHEEWSGDGHDKLAALRFPIYGIRDNWSGKWLGIWVVPNNQLSDVVAYLGLCIIEEYGETMEIYGIVHAQRELFDPEIPIDEIPVHRFLRSVTILPLNEAGGVFKFNGVILFGITGIRALSLVFMIRIKHITEPVYCRDLAIWLWSTLIQENLDELKEEFNTHRVCYDAKKANPSVNVNVFYELKKLLGGEELIHFVSEEFSTYCENVFQQLDVEEVTFQNAWDVFMQMLPLVFEDE
ncbi:hypothetical protein M422DRAFT_259500 [Sphaerobolus stellatus SS14]|uniref:Uncharacterized protein n=1 Tax=Sphaerobolus stellatus (strain SS14) TaxID=990650 RepID=A0A0C9VKC7_SPHS4|nr:hypothetical protein M422DRAFT_259500 [Sphaerobolus stellatus SS14]